MANGFIKLHRKLRDSWLWNFDNPKMLIVWLDLLYEMRFRDGEVMIGSKPVTVKRGSKFLSVKKLAERWGVTRKTASRWLKTFEENGMIHTEVYNTGTLITVVKYEDYQDTKSTDDPSDDTSDDTSDYPSDNTPNDTSDDTQKKKEKKENTKRKKIKKEKADEVEEFIAKCPEKMRECLTEFTKMRKTIKKPLTAYALQRACTKAKKYANGDIQTMIDIFDRSIEHGWSGVYPINEEPVTKEQPQIDKEAFERTVALHQGADI